MPDYPDTRGLHDELITHPPLPDPLEPFRILGLDMKLSDECLRDLAEIDRNRARSMQQAHLHWVD